MSNRLLRDAGEALYGPRWQTELSRDLGISDRTTRRWLAGDMPPGVAIDLLRLCQERVQTLDKLVQHLTSFQPPRDRKPRLGVSDQREDELGRDHPPASHE